MYRVQVLSYYEMFRINRNDIIFRYLLTGITIGLKTCKQVLNFLTLKVLYYRLTLHISIQKFRIIDSMRNIHLYIL